MQAGGGGCVEVIKLTKLVATAELVVIANEDGRELRLPSNRLGLLGVIVVVRVDGERYRSLTDDDVVQVRALLDAAADASLN